MIREQMSSADAAWLHMDRPTNLMVITSVMWFDEPIDRAALVEVVRERLAGRYERFRQRVVESHVPLRTPHWEDDPDFDLERHVHHLALPAPGRDAELQDFVSDLMATPLDRSKPLWDLYVVDGRGRLVAHSEPKRLEGDLDVSNVEIGRASCRERVFRVV